MSEYTPTTDDVRGAYRAWHDGQGDDHPLKPTWSAQEFDRWLAAHDAEVRAEAESDPAKDERLVRYMAMVTPLGYQSALSVVQQMTLMIQAEAEARRASVVIEEPEVRRQFTAAYTAQTGTVHPLGDTTAVKADAQAVADEFTREDPEGPDYFVATRIMPPWVPVKQEGAESDG